MYKNLFPDTSASISAMTRLLSSLSIYVFFVHNNNNNNNNNFLVGYFVNSSTPVTFRIALVVEAIDEAAVGTGNGNIKWYN
jgi:hypothetical protein